MLVLLLEIQNGCNSVIDTCIWDNQFSAIQTIHLSKQRLLDYVMYSNNLCPNNLQTKGVRITEDALYHIIISMPQSKSNRTCGEGQQKLFYPDVWYCSHFSFSWSAVETQPYFLFATEVGVSDRLELFLL